MIKFVSVDISNIEYNDEKISSSYFCKRVNEYQTLEDKTRCYYSYLILKNLFAKIKINLDNLNIKADKNGKPFVENVPIYFSISHSKNYVAAAISDKQIGLDIQSKSEYNSQIAKRYFSKTDNYKLEKAKQKDLMFTRFWTKFESSLKLFGSIAKFKSNTKKLKHKFKQYKDNNNNKYFLCITHF